MTMQETTETQRTEAPASVSADAHPLDLETLYERFKRPIHSYIYRVLGSREDADDLTQEVFLRAHVVWHDCMTTTVFRPGCIALPPMGVSTCCAAASVSPGGLSHTIIPTMDQMRRALMRMLPTCLLIAGASQKFSNGSIFGSP